MAWTASKGMQADCVIFEVVKGNGLASLDVEEHTGSAFQSTLAAGKELDKRVTVKNSMAALGVRGDYIRLKIPYQLTTGTADTEPTNGIYVEVMEYTGVPPNVQYDVFGYYSPFPTSKVYTDLDAVIGVDIQEISVINNAGLPAVDGTGTTAVSQRVRGSTDSRITGVYSLADPTSAAGTAYLKLAPASSDVFLIPAGATVWIDGSDDGMGETGA